MAGKRPRNGANGESPTKGGHNTDGARGDENKTNNNTNGDANANGGGGYQQWWGKGMPTGNGGVTREEMYVFVMGFAANYKAGGKGKGGGGGSKGGGQWQDLDERQFRRVDKFK